MKQFEVPEFYRSPLINKVKELRKSTDKLKKDFRPSILDFGPIRIHLARHFGFCYGVENAIEIAFKAVEENKGKRIFLLSEMIHNPQVNDDLKNSGVKFILDTYGKELIPWAEITDEDIVIIPAFGTTIETEALLSSKGIQPLQYNATCPFVERVWKKAAQIADQSYTIIVHGKPQHEETKATFSHSSQHAPTIIIKDLSEAKLLAQFIKMEITWESIAELFQGRTSPNFDPYMDLKRIGVVNQTTMLAEDTQEIVEYLKQEIQSFYQLEAGEMSNHFADTRDTLCYATNDNQTAVRNLLSTTADLAIVVGGYNSSNTSHLVELCEIELPTYFIKDHTNIISQQEIIRYHFRSHEEEVVKDYLPQKEVLNILITSGASCPDAVVEKVIKKIIGYFPHALAWDEVKIDVK
jgi:4-hydroxy-3-methylbut-2-enyl diphosphate reductase